MSTQQPSPKRRLRPASSDTRVFTRTSSEQAGEKYGIEDDTTWKVFGVGARIRQNVTTGYQTAPTYTRPIPISGNPAVDIEFGEAEFLKPTPTSTSTSMGGGGGVGSASSSSDSITAPAGARYFPRSGAGAGAQVEVDESGTSGREWTRYQSSPNPRFLSSQPLTHTYHTPAYAYDPRGFQSDRQVLDKAHWAYEQEKLELMVRRLKPRVKGELRGMADVFVPGSEPDGHGPGHEHGVERDQGWGDEFESTRGTKRHAGKHARSTSGSGGLAVSRVVGGIAEDDDVDADQGMASGTDTDEPSQGAGRGDDEFEFGTPAFIRSRGGLRPTKSLPARSFGFGGSSSSAAAAAAAATTLMSPSGMGGLGDGTPMAAPFTSGFFSPHVSTADFTGSMGMHVEGATSDHGEEEEDGFDMDEAFEEGGDVFGSTIGGSGGEVGMGGIEVEGQHAAQTGGLGEWTNRTDF